jgi:hypothetical protein
VIETETADTASGVAVPFVRVTTPSPAPGWYPDPSDPGRQIYWNGTAWGGPPQPPGPASLAPPPPADRSNDSRKTFAGIGVCVLAVIGLFMSMQDVSLMTGTGPVWTGVAVVGGATALGFFLRAAPIARGLAVLLLLVSLANAFYIENQVSKKRDEITHTFDHLGS